MPTETKQLTKRSKATYYKHRLDKALDILKEIRDLEAETPIDLENDLNEIKWKINYLLEDIYDER